MWRITQYTFTSNVNNLNYRLSSRLPKGTAQSQCLRPTLPTLSVIRWRPLAQGHCLFIQEIIQTDQELWQQTVNEIVLSAQRWLRRWNIHSLPLVSEHVRTCILLSVISFNLRSQMLVWDILSSLVTVHFPDCYIQTARKWTSGVSHPLLTPPPPPPPNPPHLSSTTCVTTSHLVNYCTIVYQTNLDCFIILIK